MGIVGLDDIYLFVCCVGAISMILTSGAISLIFKHIKEGQDVTANDFWSTLLELWSFMVNILKMDGRDVSANNDYDDSEFVSDYEWIHDTYCKEQFIPKSGH